MVTITSRQWALYAFSGLLSLVLVLVGRDRIAEFFSGSSKEKVPVSVLLKEFTAIRLHGGDAWSGNPETFDKGVITGATANLSSSAPSSEVLSYYLQALPPLGWRLASKDLGAGRQKLKFCKAGVSLIVDVSSDTEGTNYYLGLVWTTFRHSPAYCSI